MTSRVDPAGAGRTYGKGAVGSRSGSGAPKADVWAQGLTEAHFQQMVIDLAHVLGFRVAHFRPAQTTRGWRTPVQADGKGFPDLLMLRGKRCIAAELKRNGPKPSPEQLAWLDAFALAGVESYLWRPSQWDEIVATLSEGSTR